MSTVETVVARIQKLMNLTTERGASEAEAALASSHVQRLLAEHNLSMSAVEASGDRGSTGSERTRQEGIGSRQVYKWQRRLMKQIGELNYCKVLERHKTQWNKPSVFDGYDLIGRIDNVTTVRLMFEYLLYTIERLAREHVANPAQFFTRAAHSFREGCADRLVERLEEQQAKIVHEQEKKVREAAARARHPSATPTTLPALLSDVVQNENDLNNDLYCGWKPGTTAQNRRNQETEARARKVREAELIAKGYPSDVAYYMAAGYDENRAYRLAQPSPEPKPETEAQRRKRQKREERVSEAYWSYQQSRADREAQRLDRGAYRAGKQAGNDVGLNRQVDRDDKKRLL